MRKRFLEKIAPLLPFPVDRLETFEAVEKCSNMNFVFRSSVQSRGTRTVLYIKHAQEHLARSVRPPFDFSRMRVDPLRMRGEVRLINYLRNLWGNAIVPTIYFFNEREGLMVMNDVGYGGRLLIDEFDHDRLHPWLGARFGTLMGKLHGSTYRIGEDWCGSRSWRRSIQWYIKERMTLGIKKFVPLRVVRAFLKDAQQAPRSIVWGDPVYRNIIVKKAETVSCVDFDHAHTYDPAHDAGILTAHWWWMTLHARPQVRRQARIFFEKFWPDYTRTLQRHHVSCDDCAKIIKRAHQWAGLYMVSRTDGESGSYFKKRPQWEQNVRSLGIDLFLGRAPKI